MFVIHWYIAIFYNISNEFAVTLDQSNVSLLNTIIFPPVVYVLQYL